MRVLESEKTKLGNLIELFGEPVEGGVLVIGVVHGDEPQGKFLIEKYMGEFLSPTSELEIPVCLGLLAARPAQRSPRLDGLGSLRSRGALAKIRLPQGEDIPKLKTISKNLRNSMTKEEIILWQYIRKSQLGTKFRRQQQIDKYICDFVSFEHRIVIELDGSQHIECLQKNNDEIRDKYLENNGFRVLRFYNNDIANNLEGVIETIQKTINACPPLAGGPKSLISRWGRGGKLLFIPCLNPDGMHLNQRTNSNNVDINRNFPTKNWGKNEGDNATCDDQNSAYYGGVSPASEIETRFVINIIEKYKPKLILTLHAPYKVVNYDGPASEVAQKFSEIINYPVEASIGYPTPGSFGTWAGVERNIPIITLELDEECPLENLVLPVFEIFDYLCTL